MNWYVLGVGVVNVIDVVVFFAVSGMNVLGNLSSD